MSALATDGSSCAGNKFIHKGSEMKISNLMTVTALTVGLVACGGHGFEGEYSISVSNAFTELVPSLAQETGQLRIGKDFYEVEGEREASEIFVRKSGEHRYLIIKPLGGSEDAYRVVDKKTLVQVDGMNTFTLRRQ